MTAAVSKFIQAATDGSPLESELVIDAHMHLGPYHNFFAPHTELEHQLKTADRIGIDRLYGSSILAIANDATAGNREVIGAAQASNQRFQPYLVAKPNYPEEFETIFTLADAQGIFRFKLHDDKNNLPYDHPAYEPVYEFADSRNAVILFHTYGDQHLPGLNRVAKQYKAIKILLAHSGIKDIDSYISIARKYDNVFLETCNSWAWYGLIEDLVAGVGDEKVIFGTDMPFMSPEQQIGRILFARISDESKRRILGQNANRHLNF
ncbi:amidohydrolase family protein [Candidatus Neomarinimicrobiota bacterium]